MLLIKKRCIGEAHEEVIRLIIEKSEGNIRITEDNEITYDPEDPICIHIDEPLSEPVRSSASLFGEGFSNQYQASLYTITPRRGDGTDAVYTYGNRLRDYPCPEMEYCSKDKRRFLGILDPLFRALGYVPASSSGELVWKGNGWNGGIDQIKLSIIDRLIENPTSRRAIAITWTPEFDIKSNEPPCLQIVQCVITHEKSLNLICLFRSNDMLSAWGQNAYGLAHLQQYIVDEINKGLSYKSGEKITIGWLETISISAHMYFKRDQLELMRFEDKDKVMEAFSRFQKVRH